MALDEGTRDLEVPPSDVKLNCLCGVRHDVEVILCESVVGS
jgi:hypothetical protein